jgi:hypothetical protein
MPGKRKGAKGAKTRRKVKRSIVDELLASNAAFRALVAKSKASPRKPFEARS